MQNMFCKFKVVCFYLQVISCLLLVRKFGNKRKCLHKKRVEVSQDLFGTPTWLPFHCFGNDVMCMCSTSFIVTSFTQCLAK